MCPKQCWWNNAALFLAIYDGPTLSFISLRHTTLRHTITILQLITVSISFDVLHLEAIAICVKLGFWASLQNPPR